MFTVITEGNKINEVHVAHYNTVDDIIMVNERSGVTYRKGNPITWPTDATNGLQAIVDVKEGTLRFAYDWWPRAQTEFVVSEYVEPAPHIFDIINYWPQQNLS